MGLPRYWVNTAALSLVVEDTDFAYSGLGPAMEMTRTYNNNDTTQVGQFGTVVMKKGMFGRGWTFAYESLVRTVNPCAGNQAGLFLGKGNFIMFAMPNPCTAGPASSYRPSGNRDKLTYFDAGGSAYLIYESKKDFTKYRYDIALCSYGCQFTDRLLSSITDKNGNTVQIAYNADNTIKTVTDAAGRVTSFAYDANRLCTSVTYPNGLSSYYYYNASGDLIKTVDLMGNETLYTYDTSGNMTSMTVGGKTTAFTYESSVVPSRIKTVTDALGKTQTYEKQYGGTGNIATDMAGNRSYFAADDEGRSVRTEDPVGSTTAKGYTDGLLTTYIDSLGVMTTMIYDARGNMTSSVKAGKTTTFVYDANDNRIRMTNPENEKWQYQYDANHNITKIIRPSGKSTSFSYARGQLTSSTDAAGNVNSFIYDKYGNVVSATDPLGNKTTMTYDANGLLRTSETDPIGNKTSYTYDKNHRLTGITYADGSKKTFIYDCCSLVGITDENGNTTSITRNKLLKPVSVTNPLGNVTAFEYDATNTLIKTTRPDGSAVSSSPDILYRPSTITDALGGARTPTYDGNWNLSSLADERGKKTSFSYLDGLPWKTLDPLGNTIITLWDKANRPLYWINARNDNGIFYKYTPDGLPLSRTTTNGNNLIGSFTYDAVGNLTQVKDLLGTTGYTYDKARRITGITYPDAKSATFAYNAVGRFSSISYPGGPTAAYTYDNRNRVSSVSWGGNTITFTYDPAGNLLRETRSNGTETTYVYDKRNLVTSIIHKKGTTPFAQMSYARNTIGNVVSENITLPLSTMLTDSKATASYNDVNQIIGWGGDSYAYDADGNLTGISGSKTLNATYDHENRPTSITRSGTTTTYAYNGLGQRTKAVTGAQTVNYYYDALGRLLLQANGAGTITAYYIYAGNRLVAMGTPSGGYRFYHFDKIGNTVAMTNGSGNVVNAYAYAPFGEITNKTGTIANPFTYIGAFGVMDEGSGLYFMKNRYYDSATGRFVHKDPIGLKGGTNLYAYVGNNPVNRVDPEGLQEIGLVTGISGNVTVTHNGQSYTPVLGESLPAGAKIVVGKDGQFSMIHIGTNEEIGLKADSEATLREDKIEGAEDYDRLALEPLPLPGELEDVGIIIAGCDPQRLDWVPDSSYPNVGLEDFSYEEFSLDE